MSVCSHLSYQMLIDAFRLILDGQRGVGVCCVTELLSFEKATGQQDKGFLWSLDWATLSYLK